MSRIMTLVSFTWYVIIGLVIVVSPSYAANPTITAFSPTSGIVGTNVTIVGNDFKDATSVTFNGAPTGFTVNNTTSISAVVPEKATTGKISVTTPSGSVTSTASFTVLPVISKFTPTSGVVGDVVTVTGTAFTGATTVKFGYVTAEFTVSSYKTILATVPAGAPTGKILVTTPSGSASSAANFKVLPDIVSFAPVSGKVGTTVTITGTSFTGTTAVKFNGVASSFTVNGAESITATVPLGATTGKITVTNDNGTAASEADFPVLPTITSFTPTSGQLGTEVTISGLNFTGATRVDFRSYAAVHTVINDTTIVAYFPSLATTGKIGVTTPAGRTVSDTDFTLVEGTKIISFSPASGKAGQVVVITGVMFNVVIGVNFNGFAAQSYTIDSDTQITAVVPSNATSGKIYLDIPHASKYSNTAFTVLPDITSFAPLKGKPGDTVTIQGTGLADILDVKFDGISAASWTRVNTSTIDAVVPDGAGTGKIQVECLSGVATSGSNFTAYEPAQLEVMLDLGAEYLGDPGQVQLNYKLVGPQTYNGVLPMIGGMALLTDIEPGIYTLTLSGSHWLTRIVKDITIEGVKQVNVSLVNGDSDGDDQVNLFDFVELDINFNKAHAMADLDGSGSVNLFDYVVIDTYFGAQGDAM